MESRIDAPAGLDGRSTAAPAAPGAGALTRWAWGAVFAALGLWMLVVPGLDNFARLPGDLGDTRFNQYVLEHFFRYVTSQEADFWSAPFFYPWPMTIAFSSNHLGVAPVYALLRIAGLDRDEALQVWYLAGFMTTFMSAWWVLSRARFGPAAAATAAFFFAFGLPMLAEQGHVQMVWRAGVPLAAWWWWRWLQASSASSSRLLLLTSLALVWQLYAEIYSGVLLFMMLAAMVFASRAALPSRVRKHRLFWRRLGARLADKRARLWLALSLIVALAGIALMLPYVQTATHYGFRRGFGEIRSMLPKPVSWLISDQSRLWSGVSGLVGPIRMRWEHQLFIGVGAAALVIAAFRMRPAPPHHRMTRGMRFTLAALAIFTLNVLGLTLYALVAFLPGINSIRTVTRIILVLMWPISIVIAATLTSLLSRRRQGWGRPVLAGLAIGLISGETATSRQLSVSKAESNQRIAAITAAVGAARPGAVLAVQNALGPHWEDREIDAMLAAQSLGMPTLNGYSGNFPLGYHPPAACADIMYYIRAYVERERPPGPDAYGSLMDRLLLVGFDDCPPGQGKRAGAPPATSPALP